MTDRPMEVLVDTRDWRDTILALILGVILVQLAVLAWIWWPHISSFLSRPAPGSPQPGMDCYEVDWDEWGRPLWECRPATELPPIDYDAIPPESPGYEEFENLELPPPGLYVP